jgi:histone-lysine N-methyltransferase SETMAR
MTNALLEHLYQAWHQGWCYFVAGDESWFFYTTDFERMWLPEGAMPQSRLRMIISTPKVDVSIFWSPIGFPVITAFPPKAKFSVECFCGDTIPKIVKGMPFDLETSPRKLMLHMDNASSHRTRESINCLDRFRIRPIDHPPSSPDMATSDFYLFGKLKEPWAGKNSTQQNNFSRRSGKSLTLSDETSSNQFFPVGAQIESIHLTGR